MRFPVLAALLVTACGSYSRPPVEFDVPAVVTENPDGTSTLQIAGPVECEGTKARTINLIRQDGSFAGTLTLQTDDDGSLCTGELQFTTGG